MHQGFRKVYSIFGRLKHSEQKLMEDLLTALRKNKEIQALYLPKGDVDELTVPIILDSSSSIKKIEKIITKRIRKLFPGSKITIIPLNDLPAERAYELILTHRLFYARNEDIVRNFEHDTVASYLDKTPFVVDGSREHEPAISRKKLDEKPKVAEIGRCRSLRKGITTSPKIGRRGFVSPSVVNRILSLFVISLLILPAFYPTLLAGPPPGGDLGGNTNSTGGNIGSIRWENGSKGNSSQDFPPDASSSTNIDAKNTSSLENQQNMTDNLGDGKRDTTPNDTESEMKNQGSRENSTSCGVDLAHDGGNNSAESINESSNEVDDTNATPDSINENTFNVTHSNNSASNSSQVIPNDPIVSTNQSINQTHNESNRKNWNNTCTSSENSTSSDDSASVSNQSTDQVHNDSFVLENTSVPSNYTSNNGTNPYHNESENVNISINDQGMREKNESTNPWDQAQNINASIPDNTSLDAFDGEHTNQENTTNLTLGEDIDLSDVVEIVYSDLEQGEVILNRPVNWSEKVVVTNPLNESIEGNLTLDIPEDAFNLCIDVGNRSYNTSKIWMKLEPRESKTIGVHFQTSPVRMDVECMDINISTLLPPDAKNITIFQNNGLVRRYEDTSHVSMKIRGAEKRFIVYHNSSLHYRNVTLEIPLEDEDLEMEGEGRFVIEGKKLKWHIDVLSDASLTLKQKVEIEQGDAIVGKPVKWILRTMDYLITYETSPPSKVEKVERYDDHFYVKEIRVSSNSSLVYKDVKAWTRLPEIRYEIQVSFHDSSHREVSYDLLDTDGNNLFDTIEWIIPELSQEMYILSIDFDRVRFADRFADHINNYDGTHTAYIYSGPINYYDENKGCFLPINTTIEKISYEGFEYANLKNNFATYFDKDKVRVMLRYKDRSIIWSIDDRDFGNIQNFNVTVNGSTITYENVFDGVDVRYRVTYDGLSEEIVLKKPLDIDRLTERIELSGDCYYEESNGIVYLCSDGSRIFEIRKPFMREEKNPAERCYDLHYEIEKRGNFYYITKVVDNSSWLKDPSREYPVVVDPTTTIYGLTADGYVYCSGSSWSTVHDATTGTGVDDDDAYHGRAIEAGYPPGIPPSYVISRAFFAFDTSSLPDDCTITKAYVDIYGYVNGGHSACIQESTWDAHYSLTTSHYDAFTGSYFDVISSWSSDSYNSFDLNQDGIDSISKTGYTEFCVREYDHDYLNSAPSSGASYPSGCYFANALDNRPRIRITYTNPPSAHYYSGACDIYAGKKVTTIKTEHTDPDGQADVDDCRIRIGSEKGNYFTLQWNVDTNSYSIVDGSKYVSISGCTVTEESITNGYRLTWQFIVDWSFPFDDSHYGVAAWTDDESGASSGYQWSEAGTYTFENDLEVVSFTVSIDSSYDADHDGKIEDNEWFAGGHQVTATGTVEYEGSSVKFDSEYAESVQVQLFYDTDGDGTPDDLGDTYADTTITNGAFSITYTPGTSPALQPNAHFDVAIQGIPTGGSDVTQDSIEITSKRDNEPPSSSVDAISPYWQNSSPLTINATASDGSGSGLDNVALYYRYSPDNSSWGSWVSFGTDTSPPWSWSFTFPNGSGYYQFYSIAQDILQNEESAPGSADAICGYDDQAPTVTITVPVDGGYYSSLTNITGTSSDALSGVSSVTITIYNSTDGKYWNGTAWVANAVDLSVTGTTSWYKNDGLPTWVDGKQYTINATATDNVGNTGTDSNSFTYDTTPPSSSVDAISPYWQKSPPLTITATASDSLSGVKNVTLYYRFSTDNSTWDPWVSFETDTSSPWSWSFNFPNGTGYYEFYSIATDEAGNVESAPANKDAMCYYNPVTNNPPIINSIDLRNSTGSKLNGMIDVNKEYYFLINVTDPDGWDDISYINITAWYDQGNESSYYNQTSGGNLNLFLQYKNTTGTAEFKLLWPDDEVEIILTNCSEAIINSTTREIKISFKPKSQFRYAPGDGTWDATTNATDDLYSWNINVSVTDNSSARSWTKSEFGVYRYVSIEVPSNWVGVTALPGYYDDSNIVTITYSSNYDYRLLIYFSTNLINQSTGSTIPIAENVYALADVDPDDDITTDTKFSGIGEENAIEIINASGTFKPDGTYQTVNVQFRVYIPFGTLSGEYRANTHAKIEQKP